MDAHQRQLPSFLPNPSRVLLAAYDKWSVMEPQPTPDEKKIVLNSLKSVIEEDCCASPCLESVPVLIAIEDPPANWCGPLNSPSLNDLMM